jgi:hypothetical protein
LSRAKKNPVYKKTGRDGNPFTRSTRQTRGVWHTVTLAFTLNYLKAKEELWKLKYFTMSKYNLQKIL